MNLRVGAGIVPAGGRGRTRFLPRLKPWASARYGHSPSMRRLSAWTGLGRARADTVVELPAGAADGLEAGDAVSIEGL